MPNTAIIKLTPHLCTRLMNSGREMNCAVCDEGLRARGVVVRAHMTGGRTIMRCTDCAIRLNIITKEELNEFKRSHGLND